MSTDKELPERILEKHFKEVSNQALIVGTVVSDPEMVAKRKNILLQVPPWC